MEDQNQTSFTFAFDNFLEKILSSPKFLSAGWEWFVVVYPKKEDRYFSVFLEDANPESLRPGLVRRVSFFFVILNQSGKEIYRTKEMCKLFCDQVSKWGCNVSLPLEARGIFETNNIIVKLDLEKVVEVVDWNEMVDLNGFQIHYSQADSVNSLYKKYGDFSRNISVTNQLAKTRYMNLLLGLNETVNKPPHSLTDTELSNARSALVELTEAGFTLDLLKAMLDKVSLDRDIENIKEKANTRYLNFLLGLNEAVKKPPHSLTDTELSNARSELIELTEAGFNLNWLKEMLDKVSLDRDTENIYDFDSRVEKHIKEKVKAARYWLEGVVHSWKISFGFALLHNEKID